MSILAGRPASDFTASTLLPDGGIGNSFQLSAYRGSRYVALLNKMALSPS